MGVIEFKNVKPRHDELHNLNFERHFNNFSSDGDGLTLSDFLRLSATFSRYSEGKPEEGGVQALFNKVSRAGKVQVGDFKPVFDDWVSESRREADDVEVLTGTEFPSVRPNKQYEVKVPAGGAIYRKIKFNNPDDFDKSLILTTDNSHLMVIRSPSLFLRARTGFDYIRLKLIGPPVFNSYDVRLYLTYKDRKDVEECLLFVLIVVPPDRFTEKISADEVVQAPSRVVTPPYSRITGEQRAAVANAWISKQKQSTS